MDALVITTQASTCSNTLNHKDEALLLNCSLNTPTTAAARVISSSTAIQRNRDGNQKDTHTCPPGNRDPEPDEVAECLPYLLAQIELIDPRVIVTLGRHSMLRFYPQGKISNDHGRIINLGKRVLLPVYHPAAALRNPRLNETLRQDMRRIPEAVRESLLLRTSAAPGSNGDSSLETNRPTVHSVTTLPDDSTPASKAVTSNSEMPDQASDDQDQMTLF